MKFDPKWIDLSDELFRQKMAWWFKDMKSITTLSSTRIQHTQKGIDLLWAWAYYHDGESYIRNAKWNAMHGEYLKIYKAAPPRHTIEIKEKIAKREILLAQQNLVQEKIKLVDNWITTMNSSGDQFLQGPEDLVQSTLLELFDDAVTRCRATIKEPWMELWYGADGEKSGSWTKERTQLAIEGSASFKAGIKASGEFTYEFKGFKVTAKTEAFAGARGDVSASGSASMLDGISADAAASLEIGVKVSAEIGVTVGDYLEAGASASAFAGAVAEGAVSLSVNSEGFAFSASASVFAGFKAETEGHFILKWKGREIFKTEATAALTAGIGASAELTFAAKIGKSELTLQAGLTVGVGAEFGTTLEYSLNNLQLSGYQYMYEELWQALVPEHERYTLMMGDRANLTCAQEVLAKLKRIDTSKASEIRTLNAIAAI